MPSQSRVRVRAFVLLILVAIVTFLACGPSSEQTDGGTDATADTSSKDSGKDVTTSDAPSEANVTDSGTDVTDASNLNATSQQILAVRNAATAPTDGGTDAGSLSLPIDNATVTYVKPLIGTDIAGFFIQAQQTGPALFIGVDPASLSPVPVAGDQVSFVVTSASILGSLRQVNAITTFSRSAQGISLTPLLQDLGAATDLVTAIDSYESEYIKLDMTVATAFASSGAGFMQAQVNTAGLSGNASLNLHVRLPTTVQTSIDVQNACTVTLTGIMFRFGGVAQPSGWISGDFTNLTCNAPKVKSALATSATTAVVTFDRNIDTNSLASDGGSQFTFNNGLTASEASLTAPTQVTVTTSTQGALTSYTATVAATLKDTLGKGVDAQANTANFLGFVVPATLRLNEVSPAITGSKDLVELLVVTSGNLVGMTLEQGVSNATVLATLPNLQVTAGDLIVIHLNPGTSTTESASKTDCSDASCYSGAWDINGGATGIAFSAHALTVRFNGTIQDGAAFWDSTGTPPAGFYVEVADLHTAGQWSDCNGGCTSNVAAEGNAADWHGVGTTAAGKSVARPSGDGGPVDTNSPTDWAVGTSSFGAANP